MCHRRACLGIGSATACCSAPTCCVSRPEVLRVVGEMHGSGAIMANTLFHGTDPVRTEAMPARDIEVIRNVCQG